jgi:hypothetical protein
MNTILVAGGGALLSSAVFAVAYGAALVATRPSPVSAALPTPDLREEPPAVVNLVANGWRLNADAAEATLLDLAARRLVELRQPGTNPYHTTIHVTRDDPGDLNPYERRLFDRIRGLAIDGTVPLSALTFRDRRRAANWTRRLHHEVVEDARARGLTRRRSDGGVFPALVAAAAVTSTGLCLSTFYYLLAGPVEDPAVDLALGVGAVAFVLLGSAAVGLRGERDTPAGRAAAAHWLGVGQWLRNHEQFGELPPAAVMVWDRYLSYGAALGVTRLASAVLDLGLGDRCLVWSSHGGAWRRVRVSYPRFLPRYGATARGTLVPALAMLFLSGLLLYVGLTVSGGFLGGGWPDPTSEAIARWTALVCLPLGLLLLARGGYVIVRTIVDVAAPRTVTGQVLWRQTCRYRRREGQEKVPVLEHLAIDEGDSDRTRAWLLPTSVDSGCRDGDLVTATVRPWTRRVSRLTVRERGRAARLDAADAGPAAGLDSDPAWVGRRGWSSRKAPIQIDGLLTADDVGDVLGSPVAGPRVMVTPAGATAVFGTLDHPELELQVASGTLANLTWRAMSRATPLPGIGAEAYLADEAAMARVGDHTVVVSVLGEREIAPESLASLLNRAVGRLLTRPPRDHPPGHDLG